MSLKNLEVDRLSGTIGIAVELNHRSMSADVGAVVYSVNSNARSQVPSNNRFHEIN